MHERHQAYTQHYRNVYILDFICVIAFSFSLNCDACWSLAFCVWEWRRYTIQYISLMWSVGLHSRRTAVKIVDHIAKDIKTEIFTKTIEQNIKICVIVDEASTISNTPVLIIFWRLWCLTNNFLWFGQIGRTRSRTSVRVSVKEFAWWRVWYWIFEK